MYISSPIDLYIHQIVHFGACRSLSQVDSFLSCVYERTFKKCELRVRKQKCVLIIHCDSANFFVPLHGNPKIWNL